MSWTVRRLSEICEINLGKTPSRSNKLYWDDEKISSNIWVSIADLTKLDGRYISDSKEYISDKGASLFRPVRAGTLLMSFKLSIGKLAYADCDLYTNEAIVALPIKNKNEINPNFLYYYLQSYDWDKETENDIKLKGKTLNKAKLKEIKVPVPSLSTQQKIVEKLDAVFTQIDKATQAAEANIKNSDALFQSYLTEVFERGKKNWEIKYLKNIAENLDNRRIPITKGVRSEGDIPYYGASGIIDYVEDYIFDEDILLVSEDGANLLARTYPIAFSVAGKSWVNNHAHVLKFSSIFTQKFVEFYLNSISLKPYVSGMAQPKLNQAMLNKIPIPLPNIDVQHELVNAFQSVKDSSDKLITLYENKLTQLAAMKKLVMQKAFSGQLVEVQL